MRAFRSLMSTAAAACSSPGIVESRIRQKLTAAFAPSVLEIINDSHKHAVPKGSESHFQVVVVSPAFQSKPLLDRHRSVNDALRDEFQAAGGAVHALSIVAKTEEEWEKRQGKAVDPTPNCLGGSKFDKK